MQPTRKGVAIACLAALATLAAVAGVSARAASATRVAEEPTLQAYLSRMSWPMTQSVLHARTLGDSISSWTHQGDPPLLGQIAQACRKLREVETHRTLVHVAAPQRLRARQASLGRAYSNTRRRCNDVRATVLAVAGASEKAAKSGSAADRAASNKLAAASRTSLREFRDGTLRRFLKVVGRWRAAVLRYSEALRAPAPGWVTALAP